MSETEPSKDQPISDVGEADTTPPNPADAAAPPPGGWQMPTPVFRKTSGYLPQGYEKQFPSGETPAAPAAEADAVAEPAVPVAAADVEPQPDLSEQLNVEPPAAVPQPAVKQRSAGVRIALIVLGLLVMILFIGVFLTAIYFLFLAERINGSQF